MKKLENRGYRGYHCGAEFFFFQASNCFRVLCFLRSTEEVIALFISIAFVVDAVKGTVKSKLLLGPYATELSVFHLYEKNTRLSLDIIQYASDVSQLWRLFKWLASQMNCKSSG